MQVPCSPSTSITGFTWVALIFKLQLMPAASGHQGSGSKTVLLGPHSIQPAEQQRVFVFKQFLH